MQFSNIALASLLAVASAEYYNSTSTYVVDDEVTTVLTITSCSNNACAESEVTTGVSVVTVTENDVVTEYTTYCPLTASEASAASAASEATPAASEVVATSAPAVASSAPAVVSSLPAASAPASSAPAAAPESSTSVAPVSTVAAAPVSSAPAAVYSSVEEASTLTDITQLTSTLYNTAASSVVSSSVAASNLSNSSTVPSATTYEGVAGKMSASGIVAVIGAAIALALF